MIKLVGGMANWTKLFPLKVGEWTQVLIPQIKAVEGGQIPSTTRVVFTYKLNLDGVSSVNYFKGPKTDASYAKVDRKGPGGVKLFAWYCRNQDILRVLGGAPKAIATTPEAKGVAYAQQLAVIAAVNAARKQPTASGGNLNKVNPPSPSSVGGGSFIPGAPPKKGGGVGARDAAAEAAAKAANKKGPGVGARDPLAEAAAAKKKAIPALAWYEVTPAFIKKVELELPSKPLMAPIQFPKASNLTAEILAGPKNTKWPYAKVTLSNNGQYATLWFTIGPAGKNKPGGLVLLKRNKITGTTPTPNLADTPVSETLPPTVTDSDAVPGGLGVVGTRMDGFYPLDILPLIDPGYAPPDYVPPGFGDEPLIDKIVGTGGETEAAPFWKNPLIIGAAVLAAGVGVWMWKKKK
jgi:hypothetical protein